MQGAEERALRRRYSEIVELEFLGRGKEPPCGATVEADGFFTRDRRSGNAVLDDEVYAESLARIGVHAIEIDQSTGKRRNGV